MTTDTRMKRRAIQLFTLDRPGVLAKVGGVFGDNGISMRAVNQRNREREPEAALVVVTHKAKEEKMQKALAGLKKLKVVKGPLHMIRIEAGV